MTPSRKAQKINAKEKDKEPISTRGIDHFGIAFTRFIKEIESTHNKLRPVNNYTFKCKLSLYDLGTKTFDLQMNALAAIKKLGFIETFKIEAPKQVNITDLKYIPPSMVDIESGIDPNSWEEMMMQKVIDEQQGKDTETSPMTVIEVNTYNFQKFLKEQSIEKQDEGKIKICFDGKTLFIPGSQTKGYGPTRKRLLLVKEIIALSKKSPKDHVSTIELASIYNDNQVTVRDQISDINDLIRINLGIEDDLIESKQNEGYRINIKYRIVLVNT